MAAPLSGVTVVEATAIDAAPSLAISAGFCAKLAASLGAKVVLSSGLAARAGLPVALRAFLDMDKMVVDGTSWNGVDAVIADAATLDGLVEAPAAVLIALSASKTGKAEFQTEFTLAARTGMLDMIGDPDRAPLPLPGHQPAFAAGLAAYAGLAAALFRCRLEPDYRERIDANIEDALLWLNWKSVLGKSWGLDTPTRKGRLTEWPILRCADGWAALVFRDVDWAALKRLVDDPRLDQPRFESREERSTHRAELFDIVEEVFARFDRETLLRRSQALRLPIGPVLGPEELLSDPQYVSRNVFQTLSLLNGTKGHVPRIPVIWRDPASVRRATESAA